MPSIKARGSTVSSPLDRVNGNISQANLRIFLMLDHLTSKANTIRGFHDFIHELNRWKKYK